MERKLVEADQEYIPQPYAGEVILIKALRGPYANEPTNGWDKVDIGNLLVNEMDCYHGSILFEPAVTRLADFINTSIQRKAQTWDLL
jgi:hypothetical protein